METYQLPSTSTWWVGPGFLVCINSNSILTSRRNIPRSIPSVHEPARRVQSTLGCCFLRRKNNFSPGGLGRWCRIYMYIYIYNVCYKLIRSNTKKILTTGGSFGGLFDLIRMNSLKTISDLLEGQVAPLLWALQLNTVEKPRRDGGSWWRRPHSARWDLRSWQPPAPWRDFPRAGPTEY